MKRIKLAIPTIIASYILISIIGLPIDVWFWAFVILTGLTFIYLSIEFFLLLRKLG